MRAMQCDVSGWGRAAGSQGQEGTLLAVVGCGMGCCIWRFNALSHGQEGRVQQANDGRRSRQAGHDGNPGPKLGKKQTKDARKEQKIKKKERSGETGWRREVRKEEEEEEEVERGRQGWVGIE